jgi:hypothetical protein
LSDHKSKIGQVVNYNPSFGRPGAGVATDMAKPPKLDDPVAQAAVLGIPKWRLLFCIASHTEWARAGITATTATTMVVRRLVERDADGELALTKQGLAGLAALLMTDDE